MLRRLSYSLLICVTSLLLVACSSYRHCQWRVGDQSVNDTQDYVLRFIEADDEGWFWDRRQVEDALQVIRQKAAERDTILVTFVHGWHHSAECCDGNVEGFRNSLSKLRRSLDPNMNIVGLYVGWRGRSLPWVLDYLTFWGRKAAAERVGQNDLKEFMARLQDLYTEYRPDARRPRDMPSRDDADSKNFLGMVTIGHSFGGQVLLKAVTGSLEDQLQRLNPNPAYLRDAEPATPTTDRSYTISGIGDLIVLINPAAEASQYHRLHILSRGLSYSKLQTPLILTVSSENDKSRHRLFTWGRMAGEFFTGKPRKENKVERIVERKALGVYAGHVSHRLAPVDQELELVSTTVTGDRRQCRNGQTCKSEWYAWDRQPVNPEPNTKPFDQGIATFDFSSEVVFSDVKLAPLDAAAIRELGDDPRDYAHAQPYQPLIVARASPKIIDDHGGIFTEPFLQFLIPYIAHIEEKSRINVDRKQRRREREVQSLEDKSPPPPAE